MAPPPQSTAVQIAGRMLRIVLVIGFILEVGAALTSFAQANALERLTDALQDTGTTIGSSEGLNHLPSGNRVFIWACIAASLCSWRMLRGDMTGLVGALENERAWLQYLRNTWLGAALVSVPGEALFVGFNLLARPGMTVVLVRALSP